jgi:hypothetical protein
VQAVRTRCTEAKIEDLCLLSMHDGGLWPCCRLCRSFLEMLQNRRRPICPPTFLRSALCTW